MPLPDVLALIERGHAQLDLTGELRKPLRSSSEELAELAAAIAAEKPSPLSELRNQLKRRTG